MVTREPAGPSAGGNSAVVGCGRQTLQRGPQDRRDGRTGRRLGGLTGSQGLPLLMAAAAAAAVGHRLRSGRGTFVDGVGAGPRGGLPQALQGTVLCLLSLPPGELQMCSVPSASENGRWGPCWRGRSAFWSTKRGEE